MNQHRMKTEGILFNITWISFTVIGVAIFLFGLIVTVFPGSDNPLYLRAIGAAYLGMGLFGVMISVIPYRRHERWAWFTLWFYPVFWSVHLFGNLPPGQDHIHQIVFILLSLASLLLSVNTFFPSETGKRV